MSKPPPLPQFGLAIDWETSGYSMTPIPGSTIPNYAALHQGISFGAVVFSMKTLEPVDALYCQIKFKSSYEWNDGAQAIHGLSRELLAETGLEQEEAATALGNLIIKYFGTEKIVLLGHRVHFDECFTNQLMSSIGIQLDYNPIRLDSAAFGMMLLGIERSDQLFEACGLPPRAEHNALEDIVYTLESMRYMKNLLQKGAAVGDDFNDSIPF